jgi:uncharacterized membrane protein YkvA (DUF1232 family)
MAKKRALMIPSQGNVLRNTVFRIKLILRLIADRRINPWLKILPIGGILYIISPIGILNDIALPVIGELDDAAILWITNYLFIEFCPTDIVQEHVNKLTSNIDIVDGQDDVVDADSVDVKDMKK